jgi:hypothetical protein
MKNYWGINISLKQPFGSTSELQMKEFELVVSYL